MLFNSFEYALFLPVVFAIHWSLRAAPLRLQNAFVLGASYLFYGWWDWRLLTLIVASSAVDFLVGLGLGSTGTPWRRRVLVWISVTVNLSILGAFKYYGFFLESLRMVTGESAGSASLAIVLPVGISFYTFQTMSYSIDVYRRRLQPTRDVVAFFAFVAFFPQLVAGPIERAGRLLPQFLRPRIFDGPLAADGLRRILWGLVKKVVVADNVARMVDLAFHQPSQLDGASLAIAGFLFAIQIYCDFSGYSDIAIGSAALFGIRLSRNFAFPLFAASTREFWSRWHITLTSWFRDYVYVPLARRRRSAGRAAAAVATFSLIGLWHGAQWKFVILGVLFGVVYVGGEWRRRARLQIKPRVSPPVAAVTRLVGVAATLPLWVLFRAPTTDHAIGYLATMLTSEWTARPHFLKGLAYAAVILVPEWFLRHRDHGLEISHLPRGVRRLVYYTLIALLVMVGATRHEPFIYFRF